MCYSGVQTGINTLPTPKTLIPAQLHYLSQLYDLGQVPSPARVSSSPPDNEGLAEMISRTPPGPDVLPAHLPPELTRMPPGAVSSIFPVPSPLPGPPPSPGWAPTGSLPFGIAHDKMAVFSWESTGAERGKRQYWTPSLPFVHCRTVPRFRCSLETAGSYAMWFLEDDEKDPRSGCGPSGGTSGSC